MSEDLKILFHDEVQLINWGEGRASGPWIKLRLADPAQLEIFRGMDTATLKRTGHIFHCTLVEGDLAQESLSKPNEPDSGPGAGVGPENGPRSTNETEELNSEAIYGLFWRDLIASGCFRAPPVLRKIGPERWFEGWLKTMPSVLDGAQDWDEDLGEGRCEPAHVRRVSEGAGTAERPPYFAVPMTHEQHRHQHQHGEVSAVRSFHRKSEGWSDDECLEWLERKADYYRAMWASTHLAKMLRPGLKSRAECSPGLVRAWFEAEELTAFLPDKLRDKEAAM